MIRLGKVRDVRSVGERLICDALIEGDIERDIVLIFPLHLRMRVVAGTRILVFRLAGNDLQLFGQPFEFAAATGELLIHPAGGERVQVGAVGGSASPVATLADVQAQAQWSAAHTHAVTGGVAQPSVPAPPTPTGTAIGEVE